MQVEVRLKQLWKNTRGHDFLEYALVVGFLAVTAAAALPSVASGIVTISTRMHAGLRAGGGRHSGAGMGK